MGKSKRVAATNQLAVMAQLFKDEDFASRFYSSADKMVFNNEEVNASMYDVDIFDIAKEYNNSYGKTPSTQTIVDIVSSNKGKRLGKKCVPYNPEHKQAIRDRIKEVNERIDKKSDNEYMLDAGKEWLISRMSMVGMQRVMTLDEDETMTAEEKADKARQIMEMYSTIDFEESVDISLDRDFDKVYEEMMVVEKKLRTNLDVLNDATDGGFGSRGLVIFQGDKNSGKSMLMSSLACGFKEDGISSLYFSLELERVDIWQRMLAYYDGTKINDIKRIPKEELRQKVEELNNGSEIKIESYPPEDLGLGKLRVRLDYHKRMGFCPKVVFVDYLGEMQMNPEDKNKRDDIQLKNIARGLLTIAKKYKCCVITATQTNREGSRSSTPTSANITGSYAILGPPHFYATLYKSDEAQGRGHLIDMYIDKNRWEDNKGCVICFKNRFSRGKADNATKEEIDACTNNIDNRDRLKVANERKKWDENNRQEALKQKKIAERDKKMAEFQMLEQGSAPVIDKEKEEQKKTADSLSLFDNFIKENKQMEEEVIEKPMQEENKKIDKPEEKVIEKIELDDLLSDMTEKEYTPPPIDPAIIEWNKQEKKHKEMVLQERTTLGEYLADNPVYHLYKKVQDGEWTLEQYAEAGKEYHIEKSREYRKRYVEQFNEGRKKRDEELLKHRTVPGYHKQVLQKMDEQNKKSKVDSLIREVKAGRQIQEQHIELLKNTEWYNKALTKGFQKSENIFDEWEEEMKKEETQEVKDKTEEPKIDKKKMFNIGKLVFNIKGAISKTSEPEKIKGFLDGKAKLEKYDNDFCNECEKFYADKMGKEPFSHNVFEEQKKEEVDYQRNLELVQEAWFANKFDLESFEKEHSEEKLSKFLKTGKRIYNVLRAEEHGIEKLSDKNLGLYYKEADLIEKLKEKNNKGYENAYNYFIRKKFGNDFEEKDILNKRKVDKLREDIKKSKKEQEEQLQKEVDDESYEQRKEIRLLEKTEELFIADGNKREMMYYEYSTKEESEKRNKLVEKYRELAKEALKEDEEKRERNRSNHDMYDLNKDSDIQEKKKEAHNKLLEAVRKQKEKKIEQPKVSDYDKNDKYYNPDWVDDIGQEDLDPNLDSSEDIMSNPEMENLLLRQAELDDEKSSKEENNYFRTKKDSEFIDERGLNPGEYIFDVKRYEEYYKLPAGPPERLALKGMCPYDQETSTYDGKRFEYIDDIDEVFDYMRKHHPTYDYRLLCDKEKDGKVIPNSKYYDPLANAEVKKKELSVFHDDLIEDYDNTTRPKKEDMTDEEKAMYNEIDKTTPELEETMEWMKKKAEEIKAEDEDTLQWMKDKAEVKKLAIEEENRLLNEWLNDENNEVKIEDKKYMEAFEEVKDELYEETEADLDKWLKYIRETEDYKKKAKEDEELDDLVDGMEVFDGNNK